MEVDGGSESDEPYTLENHYAVFSFYDDYQCLSRGEVFLVLQLDGDYQLVGPHKLSGIDNELLKINGEEYKERIMGEEREKVCRTIIDSIVVEKRFEEVKVDEEHTKIEVRYKAVIDAKVQPMSEVIKQMKDSK
jgi:hypothetical protein